MATLASSKDFLAASKNNPIFAKYGKPGAGAAHSGTNAPAPSANSSNKVAAPAKVTNGAGSGSNAPTAAKASTGNPSSHLASQTPVSASENMSAFTHNSKIETAIKVELPAIKTDINNLISKFDAVVKAVNTAALSPSIMQPTLPDTQMEDQASAGENGKAKMTLSQHLHANPINATQPPYIVRLHSYEPATLSTTPVPIGNSVTFSLSFLKRLLGGDEYSPGLHYPAHSLTELLTEDSKEKEKRLRRAGSKTATVKGRPEKECWYAFDRAVNPYVPGRPGAHGAALTPLFHDLPPLSKDNDAGMDPGYVDVPVFVAIPTDGTDDENGDEIAPKAHDFGADKHYIYMGNYTQPRYSDRLSTTESSQFVPPHLFKHWSTILSSTDTNIRPTWMTEQLLALVEPKPDFEPPSDFASSNSNASDTDALNQAINDYKEDLALWHEDAARALASLTPASIVTWFHDPDAAERPGLRMWWEYLQCTGYDRGFYQSLASIKRKEETAVAEEQRGPNLDADNGPVKSVFGNGDAEGFETKEFAGLEAEKDDEEAEGRSEGTQLW